MRTIGLIGGMSWLFLRLPSSFLPQEDQGVLMTIVQLPNGATVTRTEEIITKIEDYYLDKEKDAIQDVFSVSGFSFTGSGQNYALVFAKLKDFELREEPQLAASAVVQRAMGYFFTLRDAQVFPLQPPAIPGLGTSSGFQLGAAGWTLVALLVASGLLALVALTRAGIRHFWAAHDRSAPKLLVLEGLPIALLLGACAALAWQAGAVMRYTQATADALHAPAGYMRAVMTAEPVPNPPQPATTPGGNLP